MSSLLGRGGQLLVEDPISTSVQHRDGVAVLAVRGEIDMATAPAFKSGIAEVLAEDAPALVIDLLEVRFLGSAGLHPCSDPRKVEQRCALRGSGARPGDGQDYPAAPPRRLALIA